MKPINFKGANVIRANDQPEYLPLPSYVDRQVSVSCWKMSFRERLKILFTGKLWVSILCFGQPLQPQFFTVSKKKVFTTKHQ